MTTTAMDRHPAITRDAKAWRDAAGVSYTEALRLIEDPLHQGVLGDRIVVRDVLRAPKEHPVIGVERTGVRFGRRGFWDKEPIAEHLNGDFLRETLLAAEYLQMFTPAAELRREDLTEVSSYTLKHHAEHFFGSAVGAYMPNGAMILAAATLGLPMRREDYPLSPNAMVTLPRLEVEFMRAGHPSRIDSRRGRYYQPPGFERLATVIERSNSGVPFDDVLTIPRHERAPLSGFHVWLCAQADRPGYEGRFVQGYIAAINDSDYNPATSAADLVKTLRGVRIDPSFYDAAKALVAEYQRHHRTR